MNTNKRAIDRVIDLLNDPSEDWVLGNFSLTHKRSGLEVWTRGLPVLDTNTYPASLNIGLMDKWRLWKAANTAKENLVLKVLNETVKTLEFHD